MVDAREGDMDRLAEWTSAACAELGIDDAAADRAMVLEAARDIARATSKPTALLSLYLLGLAVGRGMPLIEAGTRITTLADKWSGATCDWRD